MPSIGSPSSKLDLRVVAGEAVDIFVQILDGSGAVVTSAGSPSWQAEAQIRATFDSGTVLHTFDTSITAGVVHITATATDTADWQDDWAKFRNRWDLVITDLDDEPHVLCGGWVYLYPTVTR